MLVRRRENSLWAFALLTLGLMCPIPVLANQPKEDLYAVVRDVCTVSARLAMNELQPLLSREPKLSGVESSITFPNDNQYFALANLGFKRVEISRGFCYHNWLINWGQALAVASGRFDAVQPYGNYLATQNIQFTASADRLSVMTFEQYAKIDLATIPEEKLNIARINALSNMQGILAFAIAHELGHFALGHKPSSELLFMDARKQEIAADLFAVRLIAHGKTRYAEMGAILGMSLNTLAEREMGKPKAYSDYHPSAICRMSLMDQEGRWLEAFGDDPVSKARFEKAMGASISTLISRRQTVVKSCPTP